MLIIPFYYKISGRLHCRHAWHADQRSSTPQDDAPVYDAPVHDAHVTQIKAHSCGYEILPYLRYSPDLIPSEFQLFPDMKSSLKVKHFSDDGELISKVKSWFPTQPNDVTG